jgi:peptide/nickel transport system permease protein
MIAGYVRGRIETIIMRATDVMMSFPDEVFGIMIMVAIGTGLTNLIVAIGLLMTPRFVRLAHGPTLALTGRDFVTAAEALGVRRRGILARHLLPNVMGELLVMASLWMGTAIRLEANLSFLGLGVSPPTPTWGNMIRAGLDYLSSAWWVAVFPGIAILLTVLAFNLLGDGIRDVADPHLTT